jgi:hypothetical protein
MNSLNRFLALFLCCSLIAQEASRRTVAEVFSEGNLWKLRFELPHHLHVSGAQIKLPSGKAMNHSILGTLAKQEYLKNKWSLQELLDSLESRDAHIRCIALTLLVSVTGFSEDHPSFLMSREELKSSGVVTKWAKIVDGISKR